MALFTVLVAAAVPRAAGQTVLFDDGYETFCAGPPPGVVAGSADLLLRGLVVTPATAFAGEVLVVGDTIACAAASCAASPGASTATVVETNGVIFPGLIDTRTAVHFAAFDATDWSPLQTYMNRNQYTNETRYVAMVDAKQYLNAEGSSVDLGCELDKYGELKALLAGTTSVVGGATPGNRSCYGTLARTIDQVPNDLGAQDRMQVFNVFPTTVNADGVCANFNDGDTTAFLQTLGEGKDATALNEFNQFQTVTTTDGCLYASQTTIVNGSAAGDTEFTRMGQLGMSLVWQPRHDMTIYGQTANIPLALSRGVDVALGTSWSLTGSRDLLDELRFAAEVDDAGTNVLDDADLVDMVTVNAAEAIALQDQVGAIAPGLKADLVVVARPCAAPYAALRTTTAREVRLVLVGGVPLYGDATLQGVAPVAPGCESLDVCGVPKFVCVAETGGTATNKFGQTMADIVGALSTGLSDYDAMDFSAFDFAPLAPLFTCN